MKGERYIRRRIKAMDRSYSFVLSSVFYRVGLVVFLFICLYFFCDSWLKFANNFPSE